ncbi:MAG: LCP family protein [Eubacterium sp.]|nr:LCP family protein [Eubacterium sp.]
MERKQLIKTILIIGLLVVIAAGAFYAIHLYDNRPTGKAERQDSAPDPQYLYLGDLEYVVTDNIKTYLITGTDGAGSKPNAKHYHGPMADYELLLIINKTKGTYGFIQIDRDTMTDVVQIGEDGDEEDAAINEEQICTATWYGKDIDQGLENLTESVSGLLGGLEIDGYYAVNMDDIDKVNNAVGGVTVKIEDDFSEYDEEMVPGAEVHLSDEQAVRFVRSRMEIGEGTNESRMSRQRVYMQALMDESREKMASDKSFPVDVYTALKDVATTNIPGNRISAIANLVYKSESLGIRDIEGEHTEGRVEGDEKDYVQFYADEESIAEILTDLCGLGEGHEY